MQDDNKNGLKHNLFTYHFLETKLAVLFKKN